MERQRPSCKVVEGFDYLFDQKELSSLTSIAPETDVGDWIEARYELENHEYETFEMHMQGWRSEQMAREPDLTKGSINTYLSKLKRKGFIESREIPKRSNSNNSSNSNLSELDLTSDTSRVEQYLEEEEKVEMNELTKFLADLIEEKPGDPKKLTGIIQRAGKDASRLREHELVEYNVDEDAIVYGLTSKKYKI